MAKKIIGIEIGNHSLKVAVADGARASHVVVETIPDNLVKDDAVVSWEAMADFLKETLKKHRIGTKTAYIVVPESQIYYKRTNIPIMSVEQLRVNLPYEFRDYITEEKEKYLYDYVVLNHLKNEEGIINEIEIIGVAMLKEIIDKYKFMARRAGLKLVSLSPEFSSYRRLLNKDATGTEQYAFLDLGHNAVHLRFFGDKNFEITRNMDMGVGEINKVIAELYDTDEHMADIYKIQNHEDVLSRDECKEVYNQIAVEIMRVINFYNFNHPDKSIEVLYCCGGGALIQPLLDIITETVEIPMISVEKIGRDAGYRMPKEQLLVGAPAIGALLV